MEHSDFSPHSNCGFFVGGDHARWGCVPIMHIAGALAAEGHLGLIVTPALTLPGSLLPTLLPSLCLGKATKAVCWPLWPWCCWTHMWSPPGSCSRAAFMHSGGMEEGSAPRPGSRGSPSCVPFSSPCADGWPSVPVSLLPSPILAPLPQGLSHL